MMYPAHLAGAIGRILPEDLAMLLMQGFAIVLPMMDVVFRFLKFYIQIIVSMIVLTAQIVKATIFTC